MSKRRKIGQGDKVADKFLTLRQIPGLSAAQCRQVVVLLNENENDTQGKRTCSTRKQKYPQVFDMVSEVTLSETDGWCKMAVVSLPKLLQAKCDVSVFFRSMLLEVLHKKGSSLELVVAWDEAVPGNVLAPDLSRKAGLTYATIAHLPVPWTDESWWTLGVARSHLLQKCSQGYPLMMSKLLEHVLSETKDGFTLMLDGHPHLCFLGQISVLADADGLRLLLGSKGASGFKCCYQCTNVITGGKEIPGHEHISSSSTEKFRPQTTRNLKAICDHLQAIAVKTKREEAEKLLGWHSLEMKASFLQNECLQDVIQWPNVLYDPMHCWVANGIVGQELGLWYTALLDGTTFTVTHLLDYMSGCWKSAGGNAWCAAKIFHTKKWIYGRDFRGDASETLMALPLVVAFGIEVLDAAGPNLQQENESLRALLNVVRTWTWSKRQQTADPNLDLGAAAATLQRCQVRHLELFKTCYGQKLVRPKHHFSLHIPAQMQRKGWITDCFPVERRHGWYKQRAAPMCKRLSCLHVSALLEMIHLDLNQEKKALPVHKSQWTTAILSAVVECVSK